MFISVNNVQKFIHRPNHSQVEALNLIEFMYFYPQKSKVCSYTENYLLFILLLI